MNQKLSKKRKSIPRPSISSKDRDGSVCLDVYSIFMTNPRLLLSSGSVENQPRDRIHQQRKVAKQQREMKLGKVNMVMYKNTKGAPQVVWKKGIS
jgi:hypothetical protein